MQAYIFLCLTFVLPLYAIGPAEEACNQYQQKIHNEDSQTADSFLEKWGRAKPREFPFIVSFKYVIEDDLIHECSGALITSQHVVTTASCMHTLKKESSVRVLLGATSLYDTSDKVQIRTINKTILHPQYRRPLKYNDIAIVELSSPINITKYVQPICLQYEPSSDLTNSSSLIASGWGYISYSSDIISLSDLLKINSLKTIKKTECQKSYAITSHKLPRGIDDSMICVMTEVPGIGIFSGGSLIQTNSRSISLIGLVSFGDSSAPETSLPDVYSSVYHHLHWIEDIVWPNEKKIIENTEELDNDNFVLPDHLRFLG